MYQMHISMKLLPEKTKQLNLMKSCQHRLECKGYTTLKTPCAGLNDICSSMNIIIGNYVKEASIKKYIAIPLLDYGSCHEQKYMNIGNKQAMSFCPFQHIMLWKYISCYK